ncbi:hypothetical protein D3C71_2117550 [compost metagenome]
MHDHRVTVTGKLHETAQVLADFARAGEVDDDVDAFALLGQLDEVVGDRHPRLARDRDARQREIQLRDADQFDKRRSQQLLE